MWRSNVQSESLESDESVPIRALLLSDQLKDQIVAHLLSSLPNEGCGLLAVTRLPDQSARATHFYPGTNDDASPTRYTMEPAEVLAAFRDLAAQGWSLGAIVHSHPATPPTPSPTDLREAFYPEALMLIVSFATAPPMVRAWALLPQAEAYQVVEVPINSADYREGV